LKKVKTAYACWFGWMIGVCGLHRFYMGKIGTGILWTFTGGLFGFGLIYDAITMRQQVKEVNEDRYFEKSLEDFEYHRGRNIRSIDEDRYRQHHAERRSMEQIMFQMAKNNKGIVSPAQLALEAQITADEAKAELDEMLSKGYAELRVKKSGVIVYAFAEFLDPDLDRELSNLS
jgi:predicted transcriptional regulator